MPEGSASPSRRTLPARECKVTEYTKEHFGEDSDGLREKRWRYAGFEPGVPQPFKSLAVEVAGAVGKALAAKAAPQTEITYNGELPISMTFGPSHGCGAGWYDECGNTFRVGVGSIAWAVMDEVGEVRGARDNATYVTLVELFALSLDCTASRLAANLRVIYYVNGTMIQAYGLDPDGIVPARLVSPVIWWRMPVWNAELPHVCVAGPALPLRVPQLDNPFAITTAGSGGAMFSSSASSIGSGRCCGDSGCCVCARRTLAGFSGASFHQRLTILIHFRRGKPSVAACSSASTLCFSQYDFHG